MIKKIKKSMIISLVVLVVVSLVLAGCLNYKAYDLPTTEKQANTQGDDTVNKDLVDKIAKVEQELAVSGKVAAQPTALEENASGENALTGAEVAPVSEGEEPTTATEDTKQAPAEEVVKENEVAVDSQKDDEELTVITVKENELVKLKITAVDPDKDQVAYSFSKPLDKNGEWKTNYGDAGEYLVTLTATDGKLTSEKKVKIVVERVNVPPVIAPLKDITVKEGETVKFTPEVSDPNKDKVTVTISDPVASGTWVTDHASAGKYKITVTASDGELTVEKTFLLTVQEVNQLPQLANLPDTLTVKEGAVVTLKPEVTDLDGDQVKLTISDPVGDDGTWETTYTDHGEYFVTVTANDGKDTVSKRVSIVVEDVNMPPQIVDVVLVSK